ncbi:MAG: Hemolysin A [Candidatus Hydrogenedentes bacterium ADurb.Bin179]|mgnify:CR=1 FL=1|nr:MAG: Hemolysin A [Candidatus Hydrogenedentes bacterium ADurb.Bin179]
MEKERLDSIVAGRFGVSRSKARGLIYMGRIQDASGAPLNKPGARLDPETRLHLAEGLRFVSRGGEKLNHAFESFPVSVDGKTVIDVGASTGGFTDCLLQRGARRVYAVDVGYGQLAWELRQDARVVVMDRCNIRTLTPERLETPPEFFTADCSFISLKLVIPALLPLLATAPEGIVLIKPQFEAGRDRVRRGGVVKDAAVHEEVIQNLTEHVRSLGFRSISVIPSPLLGPAGNREFLAWLHAFEKTPPETAQ